LSTNDIREKEGLNPIDGKDGGEDYWQPVNMTVVGAEPDEDDASGKATPLPENKPDSGDITRAEERAASVFVSHTVKAYLAPYSDAFNRILSRDKRGLEQVSKVFLPLLMGVRSAIAYPVYGGDVPDSLPETDKFLDSYISSMSKRADAWKAEDSKPELERAVKAIAISVLREQAAARVN
jgi:hypothetical protein